MLLWIHVPSGVGPAGLMDLHGGFGEIAIAALRCHLPTAPNS